MLTTGPACRWITKKTWIRPSKTVLELSTSAEEMVFAPQAHRVKPNLFVLLHRCIKLLGQIVSYIRHPRLLFVGAAHAALVLVGLFIVLLFGVLAVGLSSLWKWTAS